MIILDDLLGLPFVDGGRGPTEYDCWGLVREVYRRYGVTLPNYPVSAMDAAKISDKMTEEVGNWQEVFVPLPVPCLVVARLDCCSWANHVGVYIGNGKFIHAYQLSGVVIERIGHPFWNGRILGYYVPRG